MKFYGLRAPNNHNDNGHGLVEVGDYTDLDMGSYRTMDGPVILRDLDEIDDEVLDLIPGPIEIVEIELTVGKTIKEVERNN